MRESSTIPGLDEDKKRRPFTPTIGTLMRIPDGVTGMTGKSHTADLETILDAGRQGGTNVVPIGTVKRWRGAARGRTSLAADGKPKRITRARNGMSSHAPGESSVGTAKSSTGLAVSWRNKKGP